MTEEELAKHDSKTLLQLLLSADARCDALTAQLESTLRDRKFILEERDRTFALILARAEKAEAERDRLGREVNVAKYGQPDFAWSVHLAAMAEVQAERDRLRALLAEADRRIAWEAHGFGNDFADRVEAALKGESHE